MKRLLSSLAVATSLVALPLSHFALAQPGKAPAKERICHITGQGERNGVDSFVGHIIEVSARALPAHCRHGDHQHEDLDNSGRNVGDPCGRPVTLPEDAEVFCGTSQEVETPPWYQGDEIEE